jgi:PIN domain nuclease of toxin-antitoxin system
MRYLLDSHAFLWFAKNDPRLSPTALSAIQNAGSELYLSVASAWEISIKVGLGKLQVNQPLDTFLPRQLHQNGIQLLPITLEHAITVSALPLHHRDPFDRLLVAQSSESSIPLISADPILDQYGIQRIW